MDEGDRDTGVEYREILNIGYIFILQLPECFGSHHKKFLRKCLNEKMEDIEKYVDDIDDDAVSRMWKDN